METLTYYAHVIESMVPGLQLLFGLLVSGKVLVYGGRLVYLSIWRR